MMITRNRGALVVWIQKWIGTLWRLSSPNHTSRTATTPVTTSRVSRFRSRRLAVTLAAGPTSATSTSLAAPTGRTGSRRRPGPQGGLAHPTR